MTKERIEDIRQSLIPFVKKELLEINYDGLGKSDATEFEKDLNEVLDLASKTLERQPSDDCVSRQAVIDLVNAECVDLQDGSEEWRSYVNETIENIYHGVKDLPTVTPTQRWIPLVWDEYPTVDSDGNDDYVYGVDYSVPMPKKDEWVLVTDEKHNVVKVQYDGYDFGDYARENILAWSPLPKAYEEK